MTSLVSFPLARARALSFLFGAASLFGAATMTGGAMAAGHDGRWSLVLTTTVGKCEPQLQAGFFVRNADILASKDSELVADGAVEGNGAMWARLSREQDIYRLQGNLRGSAGSGAWSSGTRYCGGNWRAVRVK